MNSIRCRRNAPPRNNRPDSFYDQEIKKHPQNLLPGTASATLRKASSSRPRSRGGAASSGGAGPVLYYPTATQDLLGGGGKFGLGPTFVVLKQTGGWTMGMLANQIWSVAGDDHRSNLSTAFVQPFLAYTTKTYTTFGLNTTESSYNWKTSQWTVPLNLSVTQVFKIGKQPMSLQLGGRYYADGPSGAPDWGVRLTFTLLFPTGKPEPEKTYFK